MCAAKLHVKVVFCRGGSDHDTVQIVMLIDESVDGSDRRWVLALAEARFAATHRRKLLVQMPIMLTPPNLACCRQSQVTTS